MKTLLIAALLTLSATANAAQWQLVNSQEINVSNGLWTCTYQQVGSYNVQVLYKHCFCPFSVWM